MFKNRSKVAFASALIATLYVVYLFSYFGDAASTDAGGAIAAALIMPHLFMNALAVVFNWIGFIKNKKWAIIVALVLYCVAAALFMLYFMFDLPSIILSAVAISKVSKINQLQTA